MNSPAVQFQRPRKRFLLPIILVLLGVVAIALVFFLKFLLRPHVSTPPSVDATPAGSWGTPPPRQAGASARMGFVFRADGTGLFTWQTTSTAAPGQAPLLWSLDASKRLVIRISPLDAPTSSNAAAGTPIDIFNSHPWLWRADHSHGRLIIGKLTLIEKRNNSG